ncbi:MAG: tRNA(Ile)-lysidine synthetase, partial [Clostridia bacterium]|nr:tRNA(Ile)-lysidine synthetase [Clostridia bacterium]
ESFWEKERPEEAEHEKQIAQNLCAELGIPFYHEYGDTISYCEANKKGTEEGARELRYDFLARTAK